MIEIIICSNGIFVDAKELGVWITKTQINSANILRKLSFELSLLPNNININILSEIPIEIKHYNVTLSTRALELWRKKAIEMGVLNDPGDLISAIEDKKTKAKRDKANKFREKWFIVR